MAMNPIDTTERIKTDYKNYLKSILQVKNSELTNKAFQALSESQFVKGPFLESTPPFLTGKTLNKLIQEGVASKEFKHLEKTAEINRPLYIHQEASFRKVTQENRNIIVATGTGSGKTECFLYPIFNELMKQKESNQLKPGVQALLLYPMNALANDQMKRLRSLLKDYPEITFGRYTGETIENETKALEDYKRRKEDEFRASNLRRGSDYQEKDLLPLSNELISRDQMRKTPPHILLTNYAMLEYLLIRPDDTPFFDGSLASQWKFVVLDEAHTYKGANGTEIALLLRRLKERICKGKIDPIRCIATSATLGSPDAMPDLAAFATQIFDEPFEVSDIITSKRMKRETTTDMVKYKLEDYKEFKNYILKLKDEEIAGQWLYSRLVKDERIIRLLHFLENKPRDIRHVSTYVFSDYSNEIDQLNGLVSLIELGSLAKQNKDSSALIPARYHLFVRALEGFYVSLFPEKKVFLDRREYISVSGAKIPVFELTNCQECGQEYLFGKTINGFLRPPIEGEKNDYYFLPSDSIVSKDIEIDSDDEVFAKSVVEKMEPNLLCTSCGKIMPEGIKRAKQCCSEVDSKKFIKVYKMLTKGRDLNTCASCGAVGPSKIKRFLTANQPATYIIASSLYSMIPPVKINIDQPNESEEDFFGFGVNTNKSESFYDESGRKLLVFSDNRQEAAFFAAYMGNKYNQLMWRKLMLRELKRNEDGVLLVDLISRLVRGARKAGLYPEGLSPDERESLAGTFVMKEFIGFERNRGLEGSGYIHFIPEDLHVPNGHWGLTATEITNLTIVIMNSLRLSGAVKYPDNVNPEGAEFQPKNRHVLFRESQSGHSRQGQILSFLPMGNSNNKRLDFFKKILESNGIEKEEAKAAALNRLQIIYQHIFQPLEKHGYIEVLKTKDELAYRLNYKKWKAVYYKNNDETYRCNRCGKISHHNVKEVCPEFRCNGKLVKIHVNEFRNDPYYSSLFDDDKLIPMISKEHTGQLSKETASTYQTEFENGDINLLSCTTTFEMGVDVGQLEAILLRNVPPETANYIQRAGRAGRRTSSTAFSVTYARRNSHDLNYFQNPAEIISGRIKAPYIEINNDKIAARHVNSIVMAWFFRLGNEQREFFKGKVAALVGKESNLNIVDSMSRELAKKPQGLLDSITDVLTPTLVELLGIEKWDFVERLVGDKGTLTRSVEEMQRNLETLDDLMKKRQSQRQPTDQLLRLINTFENTATISFLAQGGVIPKYGFPVDVVKLETLSNSSDALSVDLSRDLKLAVSEYAPGSEVIAAGRVWTSHVINRVRDKEWPTYKFYECPHCKMTTFPNEVTTLDTAEETVEACTHCGTQVRSRKMVVPIFGFSTSWAVKPKIVGESRPRRFYPTRVQFGGFKPLDGLLEKEVMEKNIPIGNQSIKAKYAPEGKLVIMNRGINGGGLFICKSCGFAASTPQDGVHKNKLGHECGNKYLQNASLGHIFQSDVLRLHFPVKWVRDIEGKNQWTTLLYSILEGASDALGIARDDINGCIDQSEADPILILFDETPGGAGHVKRIYNKLNEVLRSAYRRVDGHCGCGSETACYGCLRGYSNQLDHERLARGLAKEYLEWLLLSTTTKKIEMNSSQKPLNNSTKTEKDPFVTEIISIPEKWKESLKFLMSPDDSKIFEFAQELIRLGVKQAPDEIGFELASEEQGELGYEAKMVWQKQKVAVISNEDSDLKHDTLQNFKQAGWQVFTTDHSPLELISSLS